MSPESAPTHPRRNDGLTRISLLAVLVLLMLAALGIRYWLLPTDHAAALAPAVAAAAPATPVGTGDVDALLARARRALGQQHLLAPTGDNAVAWYLAALQRQPDNRVAVEALREIFPFAAAAAERTIDQGEPAEAQRQIDLLARADPSNYTLTLLRARLAAKQQLSPPATVASVPPSRSPSVLARQSEAPARTTPAAVTATTAASPVPVQSSHAAASQAAVAVVHPPVLVRRSEPYYPEDARRTRRQGWVELQFTVAADGSVEHARVADADPKNLFDHAALSAVERWRFTPATRNGHPVATPMRERINFHL